MYKIEIWIKSNLPFIIFSGRSYSTLHSSFLNFKEAYCRTAGGVTLRQPIGDDEDGLRGFEVVDADGYVLFFGRPNET